MAYVKTIYVYPHRKTGTSHLEKYISNGYKIISSVYAQHIHFDTESVIIYILRKEEQ